MADTKGRQKKPTQREKERASNDKAHKQGVKGLIKTIRRYYPRIYSQFADAAKYDSRSHINMKYTAQFMLMLLFFKYLLSYVSMCSFGSAFNNTVVLNNVLYMTGMVGKVVNFPCTKAINDFLKQLEPTFLENTLWKIVSTILRTKSFDKFRLQNKWWLVAIDATQTYHGKRQINSKCLHRTHNRGTENEYQEFYIYVLCARVVFLGTPLSIPFGVEFVENDAEDEERQKHMGREKIKQDCELKAFDRLAKKLKKRFPQLPICIVCDALYVGCPVIEKCAELGWELIIRYKAGAYPEIMELVEAVKKVNGMTHLKNSDVMRNVSFVNDLELKNGHHIGYIEATALVQKTRETSWARTSTFNLYSDMDVICMDHQHQS